MSDRSTLSAPVGVGQINKPSDVLLIRQLLNRFILLGALPGFSTLSPTSSWDASAVSILRAIEKKYFFGKADPNNKLENDDTLFNFLVNADLTKEKIASSLSNETYKLAAVMVPGGADWTKRSIVKKRKF